MSRALRLPFVTSISEAQASDILKGRMVNEDSVLPELIRDVPQDASEGATQTHACGAVLFGFEPAGFCYGGAGSEDASEIAWIYGEAASASEKCTQW